MPVRPKICVPYITGHRQNLPEKKTWLHRDSKKEFRPKRAEKRLREFLLAYAQGSRAEREHYEFVTRCKAPKPLTKKECEAWAKKEFARITGRGLGEAAMFIYADLFEEWWKGEWTYVKEDGQWVEKRQKKGEKHQRAGKGWKKARATIEEKAQLRKQLERERQREERRLERERIRRAWENLEKLRAAITRRRYI